jgi:hypothetical protein
LLLTAPKNFIKKNKKPLKTEAPASENYTRLENPISGFATSSGLSDLSNRDDNRRPVRATYPIAMNDGSNFRQGCFRRLFGEVALFFAPTITVFRERSIQLPRPLGRG